jgi:hypothetical protein
MSSSGRIRTCGPPVTSALTFLLGSDYLITRSRMESEGVGRL